MRGTFWKTTEVAALREHYPTGGSKAVMQHVNRSMDAIRQAAKVHGVTLAPGVYQRLVGNKKR